MARGSNRMVAALAAAWEAEVVAARTLTLIAERSPTMQLRSRLLVLSAFCRAHASRLLARLSALGVGPLPVPPSQIEVDGVLDHALRNEALSAKSSATRYGWLARLAREQMDTSTAWICELNRSEDDDRANELLQLANAVARGETIGHEGLHAV